MQVDRRTEIYAPGQHTLPSQITPTFLSFLLPFHSPCYFVRSGGKNRPAFLDFQASFLPIVSSSSRTLRRLSWGDLHAFLALLIFFILIIFISRLLLSFKSTVSNLFYVASRERLLALTGNSLFEQTKAFVFGQSTHVNDDMYKSLVHLE